MKRLLIPLLPCLLSAQVVPGPARIQVFQTTAKAVRKGSTVTLRWSATGADQVRLEPLDLILPARGEITHTVTGRTVYWLHVSNATGGQSVPLVVDLLPEESAPAIPTIPAGPPMVPIAAAPERPKLAALPPSPSPQAPALPAAPARRMARHRGTRRVWIQFAATASTKGAARLRWKLKRVAATESTLQVRNRRSGRPLQLVRNGPFPSVQAARLRLRELAPAMQAMGIRPIILFGPPQPVAMETTYLADSRQPE
ncbi:MAG: hypothetical protein P4L36_13565 [Holophaga sp.]|nr:hypothetical protein [Holophaga sp.]